MKLVLDASVLVKWLFEDPEHEPLTEEATELVSTVIDKGSVVQPIHWLPEVAAVVARVTPEIAVQTVTLLDSLELPTAGEVQVLARACRLAVELEHHLFDTLYHAVALERGATLITADERYLNKARHLGAIVGLADWHQMLSAQD